MTPRYCEVALPVPLRTLFTYSIPAGHESDQLTGRRVLVPFRKRKMIGVVVSVTDQAPGVERVKEILEVLDPISALPPSLIELGQWISRYYVAPIGETFRSILPPEPELRQQREYHLTEAGQEYLAELVARGPADARELAEFTMLDIARNADEPLALPRFRKVPDARETAERLVHTGRFTWDDVVTRRKERLQIIVAWKNNAKVPGAATPKASTAPGMPAALDAKESSVRAALLEAGVPLPLPVLLLAANVSRKVIERLERAGRVAIWEEPRIAEEDPWDTDYIPPSNVLNAEQSTALEAIRGWLNAGEFSVGLIHGVTGSGKTEIYLGAVEAALARGKSALVLVPEIALTLWMSRHVRARFGPKVAVLHSALTDSERAREWWGVRRGDARIVVGTRSAVFAPLENLGLILVDEEQESSYKQEETPRYHGRDTAIYRARLEGATVVLGSATPSLESYHNARTGKYKLLELKSRVENRPLAQVRVVDLRDEFRAYHKAAPISESLRAAIADRLAAGTQAMILINRRGYSWFLLCRSCGHHVQCVNCSIALTYHKNRQRLECHYCGYSIRIPKACPKCSQEYLYFVGDGAERVEEYLNELFPKARIARLDRDTVRTKQQFQKLLGAFAKGEIDVLVGTQMVAKGHDFERVTLVGVVAADLALGRPDFRAAEKTFQLLTQVSGRAGRGRLPGEVLVETYYPEHYAIEFAARQDYGGFFEKEAHFRRMMHYPPYTALANVLVRDRKVEHAIRWSRALAEYFAPYEKQGMKILGPAAAPLARIKQEFRFQFLLKTPKRSILTQALAGCLDFCEKRGIPETAVIVDVDPSSMS
ncbi:MAG: primosomal protein N' [Candidatus Acidiferrales bacterium]